MTLAYAPKQKAKPISVCLSFFLTKRTAFRILFIFDIEICNGLKFKSLKFKVFFR